LHSNTEAVTSATPLSAFREHAASLPDYWQLFLGNIHGKVESLGQIVPLGAGSLGETSALLIMIGGLYLVVKKIASWQIVLSFFGSFITASSVFHIITPEKTPDPLYGLLSGGVLYGY